MRSVILSLVLTTSQTYFPPSTFCVPTKIIWVVKIWVLYLVRSLNYAVVVNCFESEFGVFEYIQKPIVVIIVRVRDHHVVNEPRLLLRLVLIEVW